MGKRIRHIRHIKHAHFKKPETKPANQLSINERKTWYREVCFQVAVYGKCDPKCIWFESCELKDGKVHKLVI